MQSVSAYHTTWRGFLYLRHPAKLAGPPSGVIKRKLSFGVASESGRQFLERTLRVLATCRQQGIGELAYLQFAFQADFAGQTAPPSY